jgi:transposase
MDMWQPYRRAVEETLPNATVVVDKFHIQRMGNNAMETIRKQLRASLSDKRRRTLKKDRYILLRRRRDLKEQDILILQSWTHNFPTLGAAYELKESFFDIWDETNRQAAESRYDLWQADIPIELADQFEPIVTAMTNWRGPIFAYFDTGLTNAYTEAMNGLIRVIDRAGRGYSFEALRAKMLYSVGLHKIQRPAYRKARKGEPPIVFQVPSVNFGVDISTLAKALKDGSFDDLSTH